jgi:DNA-nicking Smr family endonuclease
MTKRTTPDRGGAENTDAALWRRVIRDVRPLKPRRDPPPAAGPDTKPTAPPAPPPRSEPPPGPPRPRPTPAPPPLEAGMAAGLDKRTLLRLKRGLIPPEGEIDLHRMTQEEAHDALDRFFAASQTAGRRCVLVITGKGYGAGGAVGVLKAAVPRWLNEPGFRARVLAFCHATAGMGGEGALLVLLRRLRR